MFRELPDISWIGIDLNGNMAMVTVIEGTPETEPVDLSSACHIVAVREGYIETIIAREGKEVVTKGDFVEEGDLLITGILAIEDKTYTSDPENPELRYVHANGEVYAKTVHRFIRYQEKRELQKRLTGKSLWGFSIMIGDLQLDTSRIFWPYHQASFEERVVLNWLRPIPLRLKVNRQWEVEIQKEERTEQSIQSEGNRQARAAIKENIKESALIINKSLKFEAEENIIKVIILIEALEQIGVEKAFLPSDNSTNTEGTDALGEHTN
jgi:similar to stage IV sporulation protein